MIDRAALRPSGLLVRAFTARFAGLVLLILAFASVSADAGVFGIPTNTSTTTGAVCTGAGAPDAGCTAASANPPGWLVLAGTTFGGGTQSGDVVHQIKFYVEVTGPTLAIRVFDPGTGTAAGVGGARDINTTNITTQYRLLDASGNVFNPAGGVAEGGPLAIINDTAGTTENQTRMFSCNNGAAPTFVAPNSANFFGTGSGGGAACATAVPAGLYIFEISITADGNAANAFGVQFTNSAGVHYNAYTVGASDNTNAVPAAAGETSLLFGRLIEGGATAAITEPPTFFPLYDRGCAAGITNFDGGINVAGEGASSAATATDPAGAVTAIAVSDDNNHTESNIAIEPPTGPNYGSNNYGFFPTRHTLGGTTLNNIVDWRANDQIAWGTSAPANLPNYGLIPIKTYISNGYTGCNGSPGSCTHTAPTEPIFATSAVVASGPNPPVVGSVTTYTVTASLFNPTSTALTNIRIVSPLTSATTFVAASQGRFIDGVACGAVCTDTSVAGQSQAMTVTTLAAGATASLQYNVTVTPAAPGNFQITGIAPGNVFAVSGIVVSPTAAPNVRATTGGAHGYAVGDRVLVTGADQAGLNGVFTLTAVPTTTTFEYAVATGTVVPATVSPLRGMFSSERCADVLNGPACAAWEPAWRSAGSSPGLAAAGPACDLRGNAIGGPVNLSITKTDAPDPVNLGGNITYTVTVTNGATVAPNVQWTDVLPAGTSFVSISTVAGWNCVTPLVGAGGNIICTNPSVAAAAAPVWTLVVQVNSGTGTVTNTATVTSSGQEGSPANNSATATTAINTGADLRLTKNGSPNASIAGGNVTFVLNVSNLGPATANAPVVTDNFAATNWRFQSVTAPGYTCVTPAVNAAGTVTCTRTTNMPAGTNESILLTLSLAAGSPVGPISNTASITSTTLDPVPANNSGTDTTQVVSTCSPGANGTLTAGVVNDYWPGATGTAAAGATTINVGNRIAGGAGANIVAGDYLMVIQMQDGTFDSSDTAAYGNGVGGDVVTPSTLPGTRPGTTAASGSTQVGSVGRYEYVVATNGIGAAGGALTISAPLQNTYTSAAPAFAAGGSNGQKSFQVIRVPIYNIAGAGLTMTGNMLAAPWTGTANNNSGGGVLAFDVTGTLTMTNFNLDAAARGFRGGRGLGAGNNNNFNSNHVFRTDTGLGPGADNFGFKGEGINGSASDLFDGTAIVTGVSGYPGAAAADGDRGMGAPGNAGGGGSWDAAGGGGSNAGIGGGGGDEYCTAAGCQPGDLSSAAHNQGWTGGRAGLLAFTPTFDRIVAGGGGGGGADHNGVDPTRGHGGLGGGIVIVRAVNVAATAATVTVNGGNGFSSSATGNGGAGAAGGSIIFTESGAGTIPATVSILANGGTGGNSTDHAPGGGGGGGVVFVSPGSLATQSAQGGNNGFRTATAFQGNINAEPGTDGLIGAFSSAPTPGTIGACGAVVDLTATVSAPDTAVAGNNVTYPITVTNNGPVASPNTTLLIPVPTNSTFVSFSAPAGWTCVTPAVGASGNISCSRTGGDMPANTTEAFSMVTRLDPGIPAGTVINVSPTVGTSAQESNTTNNSAVDNTVVQQSTIAALTRSTIRGLSINPLTGHIEFATGMQRGTASFNIYAIADQNDLEHGDLLNVAPIPAPVPNSVAPIVYSVDTRPFGTAYIMIAETETSGKVRTMGPFGVGDPKLEASLARIKNRLTRSGANTVQAGGAEVQILAPGNTGRLARYVQRSKEALRGQREARRAAQRAVSASGLKLMVNGPGLVTFNRADLEAEGMPPTVRSRSWRLFKNAQPVPFSVTGRGATEALVFDASATNTTYTGETAYVLMWGTAAPMAPAVALSSESDPLRPGFTRIERNVMYFPSLAQGSDPWIWDVVSGDGNTWPFSFDPAAGDFDLPLLSAQAAPAPVRVKVTAYSALRHQVTAYINDVEVGTVEFEGLASAAINGVVPAGVLQPTGNKLKVRYSAVNGTLEDPGYMFIDYAELAPPMNAPAMRTMTADNIEPYLATIPAASLASDYLIITRADFMAQAQALAALKTSQGRRAAVVDVDRAYDRYSGGFVEAQAVRALIADSASRGRLRDVVLFGDDTFDYRGYLGLTEFPVIPSLMGWDDEFGRVPSENRFADFDNDGAPNISIGRLPAQTLADADAMLAKIQRQQTVLNAQRGRHLMVVDNQGLGDPSFRSNAETVAASHLSGAPLAWADLTDGIAAARSEVLSGLAGAPAVTHYFGHGGPEIWADEQILTVDDAPSLAALPESVYFQWACETQFFPYLFGRSLGEALLVQPTGGALASFGPSGISDTDTQSVLYHMLYSELANPNITLGEAIRRAKARTLTASPNAKAVIEGFNLIGDPSIKLGGLRP